MTRRLETAFAIGALLLLPGSEVVWEGLIFSVYAVTLGVLVHHWRSVRVLLGAAWPLLLPVLLAACSIIWSVDPALTAYRVLALTGTTAFGFFLAIRFSLEDQLRLLVVMLGIVGCASAVVALVPPHYGVMTEPYYEGAWSGIFYHRNPFGRIMALASVVFLLHAMGRRPPRPVAALGAALSVVLLLLSSSRTSVIAATGCLIAGGALTALQSLAGRRRVAFVMTGAALAVVTSIWVVQHRVDILESMQRDLTLTGRSTLWAMLLDVARRHPWLGYGYGAFWRGDTGVSGEIQHALQGWYPVHAHNGLLDVALELGIVGVAIVAFPLGMYALRTCRWAIERPSSVRLWPAVYLCFFVLSNLTESALVRQNTLYWALYVAVVLTVHASEPAS
ncbi:MAG: O-antigen ligase family protein [Vicinamibacterales bacterium]